MLNFSFMWDTEQLCWKAHLSLTETIELGHTEHWKTGMMGMITRTWSSCEMFVCDPGDTMMSARIICGSRHARPAQYYEVFITPINYFTETHALCLPSADTKQLSGAESRDKRISETIVLIAELTDSWVLREKYWRSFIFEKHFQCGTETINNRENENKVSFQLKSEFSLNDVERTRSFVEERCTLSFCYGSKL